MVLDDPQLRPVYALHPSPPQAEPDAGRRERTLYSSIVHLPLTQPGPEAITKTFDTYRYPRKPSVTRPHSLRLTLPGNDSALASRAHPTPTPIPHRSAATPATVQRETGVPYSALGWGVEKRFV
ncbi:hypothetical protein NLJ89_g12058 [Agrocybe chaxingu]|uniref:Uncharacterized protein n=1 Tax=Agrocybe chaxingu TaxID=84603 RepID=A0A9W8MMH3_9AGAR|nr:hypothetical protein NLJ89_g12058 [Agrocybe chaxingu]